MRKAAVVLAFVSIALLDCATLDPLPEATCGNGVIDATEDCDGFAPSSLATSKCGQPNEGASACRLKCSSAVDCPDGWGCAVTGICREPSGTFGSIGEGVSAGVETMVVGDFDGDRRKDIIGSGPQSTNSTAKVRVHYFGEGAALARVNALSAPISAPTVRDFNKDGVDDFAFGLDFGALGVMTGQLDRSLVPAVFPSGRIPRANARPIIVHAEKRRMPSEGRTEYLFAGSFANTEGTKFNALTSLSENGYLRELPGGPDTILGDPIWTTFFTSDATSTCGQVAIAMKAQTANGIITVFSPCRPAGTGGGSEWATARAPVVIEAPDPLDGGLHVFKRTATGPSNLLFGARKADGTKVVYLVESDGSSFSTPVLTGLPDLPLASGDLDGDGRIDFVLPTGFELSKGFLDGRGTGIADGGAPPGDGNPPFDAYIPYSTGRRVRWTSARVGQFNSDDLLDIVAASEEQPDIDFYSATAFGGFSSATISTSGPVSRLAIGDFDGDRIQDVGFVQRRSASGDEVDVAIAYGRTNGPPEAARVVGRTTAVSSLEAAGDPEEEQVAVQGLALFIVEKGADGGLPDLAFAIIIGNGDRQAVAPLLLNDFFSVKQDPNPDVTRDWVPLEVHAAAVQDPNRVDLIALAIGYRSSRLLGRPLEGPYPAAVWVAPGKGGTSFDAPRAVQDLGTFAVAERGVVFEARTAVGDIDNPKDGTSEFVVLQKRPEEASFALRVARPDNDSAAIPLPGKSIRRDAPMSLVDIDGDGHSDVVAVLDEGATTRRVAVFYNDTKSGFITPPVSVPLPDGEEAEGFAHLTTRGSGAFGATQARRELAVVTSRRVVLAAADPADRTRFVVRDIVTEGGAPLGRPTAIARGDFDGDGVDDLAVADSGALRILRQLPVKP